MMSIYEPFIKDICPVCGHETYAEGVHNGIGYIHEPLFCSNCGWSERCSYEGSVNCKSCTEYEKCFAKGNKKEIE